MTIQQIADAIAIELNQRDNHELKEVIKHDFRLILSTRMRQTIERNGIDVQYKMSHVDTLTLQDAFPNCIDLGCKVLKGSKKVPLTIRYLSDNVYLYAGTVDGTPIPVGTLTEYKSRKHLKYSKNQPFIIIVNGYPYVYGTTKLGYIRFDDIFEDISQVNNLCDSSCVTDDMDLQFPQDMFFEISNEIVKRLATLKSDNNSEVIANKD